MDEIEILNDKIMWQFRTTMLFTNLDTMQQSLAFTRGYDRYRKGIKHEHIASQVQFQCAAGRRSHVTYPLMVSNTHLPMQNQIMVTNLARDIPQ